jgi:CheY-like chemotaxis protein
MAKTILVADDNPTIRRLLWRLFETEENYDICAEASNGQEAIDLTLQCRPDLIILDLSMPVLNGLEAALELKRLVPEVPIILFTQHASVVARQQFRTKSPFDRIVSKDDAKELIRHVRSLAAV